jgi:TPR repeat protein
MHPRIRSILGEILSAMACATLFAGSGLQCFGQSWWANTSLDSNWINRPLAELRQAAERGDATGQFFYARSFFFAPRGGNVSSNRAECFRWTRRSADQGFAHAQYMASRFHFSGIATPRDPRQGLAWASRAAQQGHADATAMVADALAHGNGTNLEPAQALVLYRKAIDLGSSVALDWLGHFYMGGEGGTAITTNYTAALHCFERAASNGVAHAATHLVDFFTKGLGTPPNRERIVFWARHGADQYEFEMMEKLATLYSEGIAEPRNSSETASELLRRAAGGRASGIESSGPSDYPIRALYSLMNDARQLCIHYRYGLGTARDYVAVAQWFFVQKRAADWEMELRPGGGIPSIRSRKAVWCRLLRKTACCMRRSAWFSARWSVVTLRLVARLGKCTSTVRP